MITTSSPIVRIGVQTASPLALLVGAYLLFAGHNRPGGGFAAGLVFGAVLVLRAVSGLSRPRHTVRLIGAGGVLVGAVALLPLIWAEELLDQAVIDPELPVLGTVKSGTALLFDMGVTFVVVGLVLALIDGLGVSELADVDETQR